MNITPVVRKQSSHFVAGKQRHSNICQRGSAKVVIDAILCWLKIEDWHHQRVWSHHTCAPSFELRWLQTGDECQRMWNHVMPVSATGGLVPTDVRPWSIIFGTFLRHCLKHWSANISLWSHPDAFKYHLWFVRCSSYGFPSTENSFLATRTSPNTRRVNHLPGVSPSIWHSAWSCLIIWQTRSQWAAPTPYVTGRDLSWWWCFFLLAFVKHSVDDSEIHHHHQHHHHIQQLWTDTTPSPPSSDAFELQWGWNDKDDDVEMKRFLLDPSTCNWSVIPRGEEFAKTFTKRIPLHLSFVQLFALMFHCNRVQCSVI